MIEINKIYCENCLDTMARMPDNVIDLTVTSPPYDNLRDYNGYSFDFKSIAKELFRVTKDGGVVVWVVADQTVNGSETGTSFKQALWFKYVGFRIHDTMIWYKKNPTPQDPRIPRYTASFEYMFIFTKGRPQKGERLQEKNICAGKTRGLTQYATQLKKDGNHRKDRQLRRKGEITKELRIKRNVWELPIANNPAHPATFPEQLANDHIISWSNKHDLIYDPFSGSGTTAKMAKKNQRNYIGSEISQIYCDIANKRIAETPIQFDIFD